MDLSELNHAPGGGKRTLGVGVDDSFRELLGQLGRECAVPLSSALERLNEFATTGRIDRAGLRALRAEIETARRNGLIGQQISRYASGRVRQHHERLNLTEALRDMLAQRGRESAARGIELRQELTPVEVVVDATMLAALLQVLLDWCFEHARSPIDLKLAMQPWPPCALLSCRFAFVPPDQVAVASQPGRDADDSVLDTLPWQLLRRLAQTLGLQVDRRDHGGQTVVKIEFTRTVGNGSQSAWQTLDLDEDGAAGAPNSQPIAGSHLLVLAARRETRNAVRETVRAMGLMVDYVGSVEEAREFCATGLPHAIVYEAVLASAAFRQLRAEWTAEVPSLAFIELSEDARAFEVTDVAGVRTSRIGRDVIVSALPAALLYEMAKGG